MKITPRCYVHKEPAFTNKGYFVPCCWCDDSDISDLQKLGLIQEKFHVTNIKSAKEVFNSTEWKEFYELLILDPELAPSACKYHCGGNFNEKVRTL